MPPHQDTIDATLVKFAGREAALMEKLHLKYKVPFDRERFAEAVAEAPPAATASAAPAAAPAPATTPEADLPDERLTAYFGAWLAECELGQIQETRPQRETREVAVVGAPAAGTPATDPDLLL